jgi:hypothetical protein
MNPEIAEREFIRPIMEEAAKVVAEETGVEIVVEYVSCDSLSSGGVVFKITGRALNRTQVLDRLEEEMNKRGVAQTEKKVVDGRDEDFFSDFNEWLGDLP